MAPEVHLRKIYHAVAVSNCVNLSPSKIKNVQITFCQLPVDGPLIYYIWNILHKQILWQIRGQDFFSSGSWWVRRIRRPSCVFPHKLTFSESIIHDINMESFHLPEISHCWTLPVWALQLLYELPTACDLTPISFAQCPHSSNQSKLHLA